MSKLATYQIWVAAALAVLAEAALCWVGERYGTADSEFHMNGPASAVFLWHFPAAILFGLLGLHNDTGFVGYLLGAFQFFILFWLSSWVLRIIFVKREP